VHNLQVLWREKRDVRPRNHNLYFGNEFARFSSAQLIYCVHSDGAVECCATQECMGTNAACIRDFCCSRKVVVEPLEEITIPPKAGMCCIVAVRVVV
jgi:hypothetical protein